MTAADLEKVRAKLQFIREATRRLEQIRGRGRDSLLADPILQAAALRNLQGMLPDAHAAAFLSMASFRNRLVHLYDTVEPAEIAKILDQNLGDFAVFISAITERYLVSPNDSGGQRP